LSRFLHEALADSPAVALIDSGSPPRRAARRGSALAQAADACPGGESYRLAADVEVVSLVSAAALVAGANGVSGLPISQHP